jgi:hypothetical protein
MYNVTTKTPESQQEDTQIQVKAPDVHIAPEVYRKIMFWIDKAPGEVSGMGKVTYDASKNVFRVTEAYLLKQKNTGSSTELDATAICELLYDSRNSPGELRFWWHSHVNMPVFWSGTDHATIDELSRGGWILSTVFNKRREMLSSFCQVGPVKMFVNKLQTSIVVDVSEDQEKSWGKEYDDKCTTETFTSQYYSNQDSFPFNRGQYVSNQNKKNESEDEVAVSMQDMAGYVEMFGTDDIPPTLQELFPEADGVPDFDNTVYTDEEIAELEAQGYIFDDADADEDDESKKLDIVPVKRKGWKTFLGGKD